MGISILTAYVVQEALVLLLLDDSPPTLDIYLFLFGVRRVETSPIIVKSPSCSITVHFISEEVSISTT